MKPLYEPKGRAKEYGDLALNIYTGCPHRCYYCFAPSVLHKDREQFHSIIEPRPGIVEATKRQLEKEGIAGKLIHLCFTCDPYPIGYDTTPTREIIKAIKDSGNHVQILTKGDGSRDFDLLDKNDWYGVTISGNGIISKRTEPNAEEVQDRVISLTNASDLGIKTWVSCEPVVDVLAIYYALENLSMVDLFKIGKLNYHPSDINWGEFGRQCVELCEKYGRNYYIKEDLRKEMEYL